MIRWNEFRPSFHWADHCFYVIPHFILVAFESELNHVSNADELKSDLITVDVTIRILGSSAFALRVYECPPIGRFLEEDDPFLADTSGGRLPVHRNPKLEQQPGGVSLS